MTSQLIGRRAFALVLLATIVSLFFFIPAGTSASNSVFNITYNENAEYDGYIVKLNAGLDERSAAKSGLSAIYGGELLYRAEALDVVAQRMKEEDIQYIEPDYVLSLDDMRPSQYSDDPRLPVQWGLEMTRGYAVWNKGLTAANVRVGVIDSGLYTDHEDIDERYVVEGKNILTTTSDTQDLLGHGTIVTSVIAATNNNGKGIASLGYGAEIVPIKVTDGATDILTSHIIEAVYEAVDTFHCQVINISLGGEDYSGAFNEACEYAASKNAIIVAAVGNTEDSTMQYPAGYDSVIGVGSMTMDGVKAPSSTYNESVHVVAPGAHIYAAQNTSPNAYGYNYGTSLAAPCVASLAAIAKNYNPNMTLSAFKELLAISAVDKGAPGYDYEYGYGLVDVAYFVYYLTNQDYFQFQDLVGYEWADEPVTFCVRHGLFRGTTSEADLFSPGEPVTRAAAITAMGRMHEQNGHSISILHNFFSDVPSSMYYAKYVNWAASEGIVDGYGGGLFGPDDNLTREQLAVFLYRYHSAYNVTPSVNVSLLDTFTDATMVHPYERIAMEWMIQQGLMMGTSSTTLSPQNLSNRAQLVTVLYRYSEEYTPELGEKHGSIYQAPETVASPKK